MNPSLLFASLLLSAAPALGEPGTPRTQQRASLDSPAHSGNSGNIRFQFQHYTALDAHPDSMLIIFDRYDLAGAATVYSVFPVDTANGINIMPLPSGKYYVTIEALPPRIQ